MKRILHVNCTDAGSTGKIINQISYYLQDKFDFFLCTPKINTNNPPYLKKIRTSGKYEQALYKRITAITGYRYSCSPHSTHRIISAIRKIKPDIIHLHSANCYMANLYSILKYAKKKDIAVVITNHAEFYYTGICSHSYDCMQWVDGCKKCPDLWGQAHSLFFDTTRRAWRKMKESLYAIPRIAVVSVSPWVRERSEKSQIMNGIPQFTVLNGVDTNVFRYIVQENEVMNKHLFREKTVLFVTAMFSDSEDDAKGGKYIIQLASKLEGKAKIVIIGKYNINTKIPDNIIIKGVISDQSKLAEYYNVADVTVVASKRETFGMTVAESLCCGTPVIGFNSGGPESIALDNYSDFVSYGDVKGLYRVALKWLNRDKKAFSSEIAELAHQKYSSKFMAKGYNDIYTHLLNYGKREK